MTSQELISVPFRTFVHVLYKGSIDGGGGTWEGESKLIDLQYTEIQFIGIMKQCIHTEN